MVQWGRSIRPNELWKRSKWALPGCAAGHCGGAGHLADLIGTDRFLYALADAPAEVHRMMREIKQSWFTAYDGLYAIMNSEGAGSSYGAFELLCKGKDRPSYNAIYPPCSHRRCSMSSPCLTGRTGKLAGIDSMYHLDGQERCNTSTRYAP